MIAGLRGTLEQLQQDAAHVNVNGVIYHVNSSRTTLSELGATGDDVRLFTHLYVREDQLTLFGFSSTAELRLFETLIGVSGVGPRLALAILSRIRPDALEVAITGENADLLATVPGVGKKTAARLILELRGKLVPSGTVPGTPVSPVDTEVLAALRSLGYTAAEAHGAMSRVSREGESTVEERVVAALRELAE
jgi:Holliday junction DNA helicase RuvA